MVGAGESSRSGTAAVGSSASWTARTAERSWPPCSAGPRRGALVRRPGRPDLGVVAGCPRWAGEVVGPGPVPSRVRPTRRLGRGGPPYVEPNLTAPTSSIPGPGRRPPLPLPEGCRCQPWTDAITPDGSMAVGAVTAGSERPGTRRVAWRSAPPTGTLMGRAAPVGSVAVGVSPDGSRAWSTAGGASPSGPRLGGSLPTPRPARSDAGQVVRRPRRADAAVLRAGRSSWSTSTPGPGRRDLESRSATAGGARPWDGRAMTWWRRPRRTAGLPGRGTLEPVAPPREVSAGFVIDLVRSALSWPVSAPMVTSGCGTPVLVAGRPSGHRGALPGFLSGPAGPCGPGSRAAARGPPAACGICPSIRPAGWPGLALLPGATSVRTSGTLSARVWRGAPPCP